MARLTERELDLIQQADGTFWNAWGDMDDILVKARRQRALMFRHLASRAWSALSRAATPTAIARVLRTGLIEPLRKDLLRRRTLAELNRLDDRMLNDIGLYRGDLDHVVDSLVAAHKPAPVVDLLTRARLWFNRRAAIRRLQALDDRMLADIGLERGDIQRVVEQLAATPMDAVVPASHRRRTWSLGPIFAAATRSLRRWHAHRAAIRELEALDDRLLADIGVDRGEIAAAARGLKTGRATRAAAPAAESLHYWDAVVRALLQWDLSRQAAGQMARLHRETLDDLGYVKGDVDWVPEVLAERRLAGHRAA